MDFYVDLAVAVLLRLIKDRRGATKFFEALAKVHRELERLYDESPIYAAIKDRKKAAAP